MPVFTNNSIVGFIFSIPVKYFLIFIHLQFPSFNPDISISVGLYSPQGNAPQFISCILILLS